MVEDVTGDATASAQSGHSHGNGLEFQNHVRRRLEPRNEAGLARSAQEKPGQLDSMMTLSVDASTFLWRHSAVCCSLTPSTNDSQKSEYY